MSDEGDFLQAERFGLGDMNRPTPRPETPIDKVVSEIVGKPIKVNNPNLIKLIVKYKKLRGDSDEPDNFMENPDFIKELKEL